MSTTADLTTGAPADARARRAALEVAEQVGAGRGTQTG